MSILAVFLLLVPASGHCFSFDTILDDVGSAVKSGINAIEEGVEHVLSSEEDNTTPTEEQKNSTQQEDNSGEASINNTVSNSIGGSVFSSSPINPASPPASTPSFSAGDNIYGMLKAAKPWKKLNRNSNYIIVWVYIDGQKKTYKSIGLRRPELLGRDYFIIDVAPDPT